MRRTILAVVLFLIAWGSLELAMLLVGYIEDVRSMGAVFTAVGSLGFIYVLLTAPAELKYRALALRGVSPQDLSDKAQEKERVRV